MDIIGSKAQGDKITAKVGGNLNIETLQEKENFTEENKSVNFGISWSMNLVTQRLSKPTFRRDLSKGTTDSHYRSARNQAGFFAVAAALTSTPERIPTSGVDSSQVRRLPTRTNSPQGRSPLATSKTRRTTVQIVSVYPTANTATMTT